jgi:hypothetical protein
LPALQEEPFQMEHQASLPSVMTPTAILLPPGSEAAVKWRLRPMPEGAVREASAVQEEPFQRR